MQSNPWYATARVENGGGGGSSMGPTQGKCMSKMAGTGCRIFLTNGKFAVKNGLAERRCPRALRVQTCDKFAAKCYGTLTTRCP